MSVSVGHNCPLHVQSDACVKQQMFYVDSRLFLASSMLMLINGRVHNPSTVHQNCSVTLKMRQIRFSTGVLPWTPLWELTMIPRPPSRLGKGVTPLHS